LHEAVEHHQVDLADRNGPGILHGHRQDARAAALGEQIHALHVHRLSDAALRHHLARVTIYGDAGRERDRYQYHGRYYRGDCPPAAGRHHIRIILSTL
jgi:hypothetical protein